MSNYVIDFLVPGITELEHHIKILQAMITNSTSNEINIIPTFSFDNYYNNETQRIELVVKAHVPKYTINEIYNLIEDIVKKLPSLAKINGEKFKGK